VNYFDWGSNYYFDRGSRGSNYFNIGKLFFDAGID
jgi:hypothetical protein